jgi:hypothetical protein
VCLKENKRTKLPFSHLQNFLTTKPTDNPVFKSVDDSYKWLNIAIDYGVFNTEQIHHYNDPFGIVTFLSLNPVSKFIKKG